MNLSQMILDAGVVGAGGAGFPTHVKVNAKAEYYIINAAECEPLIETDKYLMRTFPDEIIQGVDLVADQLGASHRVIALKGKYKEEIHQLETAIQKANSSITLLKMDTFYPAGDEQVIVKLVTGKSVPERGLPLDVSAVVNNVGTVIDILNATKNKPVVKKFLSITGEVKEPIMMEVPIGTTVQTCLDQAELTTQDYGVILGGPMMGQVVLGNFEQYYVTKTTGNLLVLPKDHYLIQRKHVTIQRIKAQTKSACIQCRMCTDLCPRYLTGHRIHPHLVMRNLFRADLITDDVEFEKAFGSAINCSSCGICEMFACPMGLSPRQVNLYMKGQLAQRKIDVERNLNPQSLEGFEYKKIPTKKLIARLNLSKYEDAHVNKCISMCPEVVTIPLRQHIGAPATPVVKVGDSVKVGDVVGKAAEGALSTNIHASMDGVVAEVENTFVMIRK